MATPASPAKAKATKKAVKKPATHPTFKEMTLAAIGALKERSGSSRQAIQKYLVANYKVNQDTVGQHLKICLRKLVIEKALKQPKGTGASGSFKLGEKPVIKKKKPAAKKPAAKKAKKPAAKKPAAIKNGCFHSRKSHKRFG